MRNGWFARIEVVATTNRRALIESFFESALAAVVPEELTERALSGRRGPATLIAIGKAAPGMCRGAANVLGEVEGICVAAGEDPVPAGVELLVGDHPVPGDASFRAGRRVIDIATRARYPIIALISGGGSAVCEHPIDGVTPSLIGEVTAKLLDTGASIENLNLVRRHLSAIKGGGLARVASQPIETFAISDVCGGDPSLIASGPTSAAPIDARPVFEILADHDIELPEAARAAIGQRPAQPNTTPIEVIADGRTAMEAAAVAARAAGVTATTTSGWLHGPVETAINGLLETAGEGLTLATGEVEVEVTGPGVGGRNTHAALLAAQRLRGSPGAFAALATDGVDGRSGAAGAIVDGQTVERGEDLQVSLATSDSASYLEQSGDLVVTGATGTNVGDLWMLWL